MDGAVVVLTIFATTHSKLIDWTVVTGLGLLFILPTHNPSLSIESLAFLLLLSLQSSLVAFFDTLLVMYLWSCLSR